MSTKLFNFEGNYKQVIAEYTKLLEGSAKYNPRDFRMYIIEKMTDAYIEHTGKRPDEDILARLTDVILHEELSDPRPDKMTIEEYPIMSDRMYKVRTQGLERRRNKAGVTVQEVPLTHAKYVATDGRDYYAPIRRFGNGGSS